METQAKPISPNEVRNDLETKIEKLVAKSINKINKKLSKLSYGEEAYIDIRTSPLTMLLHDDKTVLQVAKRVISKYGEAGWHVSEAAFRGTKSRLEYEYESGACFYLRLSRNS